ncbi:type III effector [Pseudomonas sp. CDFA 602]|uniref:type III effector n=1 Tax=Pseudomonas californiensis TaxID=2829823 RepID=UPI001E5090BC|nr:type III effector [Pseudomonas californiensis]MCD5993403.1 type III effector [Pseudomonas californiensis]MCD5998806.1 type III effector [Pseudomonas californiensis]
MLAEADTLMALAESALASLTATPVDQWERPAPSTARRMASKVMPWLKPDPLRSLLASDDKSKSTQTQPPHDPQAIAAAAAELSARLDHLSDAVDVAIRKRAQAHEHLDSLRQTQPAPAADRVDQAQARAQLADSEAELANRQLRELLQGTDLLRLGALSEGHDQIQQKAEFSGQWLGELRGLIEAVDVRFADRRDALGVELKLKAAETRALISLDHDMTVAERTLAHADSRLATLRAQLRETPEGSAEADAVNATIERGFEERSRAMEIHQDLVQRLVRVDADMARLNEALGALHQRIAVDTDKRFALNDTRQKLPPSASQTQPPDADAAERVDKAALKTVRERFLARQIQASNAFAPHGMQEIQPALMRITARLDGKPAPTPLPAFAVIESVTSALADVTGNNAERARRVLDALNQYPIEHWPRVADDLRKSVRTRPSGSANLQQDILDFCRQMADVPRGIEMLHVLSGDGNEPVAAAKALNLRVFWNADQAQQSEPDEAVKGWLQTARHVARNKLAGDETPVDDVDNAAFNAVRNGYLSNAPSTLYDQHNARLKKATVEWVMRAAAADAPTPTTAPTVDKTSLSRRLIPTLNKTPFAKSTLNRAYSVGESMGIQSPRRQVDMVISRRIGLLDAHLKTCRVASEFQTEVAAAQAMLDHLKSLEKKGNHLSQTNLRKRDGKTIQSLLKARVKQQRLSQMWDKPTDAGGRREVNLLPKAESVTLPPFYTELTNGRLTAYEAVNRIDEHLREVLPPALMPAAPVDDLLTDDLEAAIKLLKNRHLNDKSDIVTLFKPAILESRLRDRWRLGGGGTLGLGVPSLPYGSISPIASPIFSVEKSRSDEAFAQLFMPILGMEMSFGKARTDAAEATVGVAVGPQVAPGVSLQGALTTRFTAQETKTSSTLMRFFRTRHKDDEMRGNMVNALDSMVRWDLIKPERGRDYAGPLESILARNPEVSISQIDAKSNTRTLAGRLAFRSPASRFVDGNSGAGQNITAEPSVYVEADRITEQRTEKGGFISVVGNRASTAQQRAGISANLNVSPIASGAVPAKNGHHGVQGQGLGLQLGASRDLAWALEKNEISPFLIGDKQDADLDRHYSTPRDMLAEINANRDVWLMRCIETLEPDESGTKHTPDNRLRAATLLETFENDIKRLGKESKYCQYNVNYSMKGRAGAEIDGYRSIQALALKHGDSQRAEEAQRAIDDIMLMRETWRPLVLIVRERARDSTLKGWRSLVRWQKLSNVDGQRTAAQFPPA